MASILPRKNKNGEIISYRVRVPRGYDSKGKRLKPFEATYKVDHNKTEKQNEKALNEFVLNFEKSCKGDNDAYRNMKLEKYAEYALTCKKNANNKLRQYRTKIVVQMRSQIFRQIVLKRRRQAGAFLGVLVQYDGKYASRCATKPKAVFVRCCLYSATEPNKSQSSRSSIFTLT
jgi:hypothetical protein